MQRGNLIQLTLRVTTIYSNFVLFLWLARNYLTLGIFLFYVLYVSLAVENLSTGSKWNYNRSKQIRSLSRSIDFDDRSNTRDPEMDHDMTNILLKIRALSLSLSISLCRSLSFSVMSHWHSFPRDVRSILGNTFCQFPMLYKVSVSLYEDRRPPWHTLDARESILFENFYTLGSWARKSRRKKTRKERRRKKHFHIMQVTLIGRFKSING